MPNTNIPLQVQQLDVANPLMILAQRERQATQDKRQTRLDELAMTESGQRQEVNNLNIGVLKKQLAQIDPQTLKAGLQSIAVDSFAVQDMLKNGDIESAGLLAQGIKATSSSLGLPATEADNLIRLLGSNPQAASQYWGRQVDIVRQNMPAIFETVNNEQGQPVAQRDMRSGEYQDLPSAMLPNGGSGGQASAVTRIYGNGTAIQALPNGEIDVKGPDGNSLPKGSPERLAAIREANANEINQALSKAGATAAGTQAIAMSGAMIDQLGALKTNVTNYDEAISALDSGAGTGPAMSRLPSVRSASIQLDNIQKQLGLDVIKSTTFGALSENELAFALSAALPTNLEPAQLKEWLTRKRDSQLRLMDYLEGAAIYLGMPGNTAAGWMQDQKELNGAGGNSTDIFNQADAIINGR